MARMGRKNIRDHQCYPWFNQKNGGQIVWPPFVRIKYEENAPTLGGLLFFLCLRLLAFALGKLRQLRHELFRVLLERRQAFRAAEVDLLALELDKMFRVDWLAAHRAFRLTRE